MKFGPKKKENAAGGADKKPKRKASRGKGDGVAKIKTMFAEHIEKMLLAAMAVVALLLVYSGFSKESLQADPDRVRAEIARAQQNIDSPTWAEVKQLRQPEPDRFDQQATQDTIPVDLTAYTLATPMHPRMQEQSKKRSDPELLAPFDIEVRGGYGAVAIKATGRESRLSDMISGTSPDTRPLPPDIRQGRGDVQLGGHYESRFFVAITGLVPYKQQFDLYQQALKGAAEYDAERDVPRYLGLMIQRAEVGDDGTIGQWEDLDTRHGMMAEPATWDGRPEELADPEHILPRVAMPLPPIVLRDLTQWAHHSTVPIIDRDEMARGEERRPDDTVAEEGTDTDGLEWTDRAAFGPSEARGRRMRDSRDERIAEDGVDSGEVAQPLLSVENGMLRYFDFTAEPGKIYRYRVQAVLEDPNNPYEGNVPSIASCETDVIVRRQSATERFRRTPWSEPTGSVTVPNGQRILASNAAAPRTVAIEVAPNRRIRVERRATEEPTIQLMTLTWKSDGPYDVPVVVDAARGAVLNGKVSEAEAIDPTAARIRKLTDYSFVTNALVLDIYGGLRLGGDVVAPGFVLIRNEDGRLEFHSEMDDFEQVERNTIPPDEEEERLRQEEIRRREEREEEGRGDRRERGPDRRRDLRDRRGTGR